MPRVACRSCGREIYTPTPLEGLLADERRCPRCGAPLENDRREGDRRSGLERRLNPPADPGPPTAEERRVAERRGSHRRRADTRPFQ